MKKQLLFLLSVFLFNQHTYAQWNIGNVGTTQDLYSVDYYSNNDIWIGSFNQIVKTNNAGGTWSIINPIKDISNASILPLNMYDIALTSSSSAIGTGLFFMGNNECILTTTNSGANWTIATNNSTVPLLRYINSVDVFSNRAVAAGNNGRIAISGNSGSSWGFVNSGTTKLINDVKFVSYDTLFAAGDGVILKSINGGSSWTSITTFSASYTSLSCKNNVVYIGADYDNTILKSTNSGASYTSIALPFASRGVVYAISKDTILCSGTDGLYVSKSGGQYWEKYQLSTYQPVKMIDALTQNQLIAVGDQGYIIKTANLALAPALPITNFSIQGSNTNVCLGDSLILNNQTSNLLGYTYQWKKNNVLFSNQYNSGVKFNTAGTFSLSLTVTNSNGSSTKTIVVTVTGHDLSPFTINSSNDTICNGSYFGFTIPNSQTGTSYQLRTGVTNIGALINGNGSQLEFAVSGTTANTTYNIKANRSNSCFSDSLIQTKSIIVSSNSSPLPNYAPPANYCVNQSGITNVTLNTLNNTTSALYSNYFDYSCCKGSTVTIGSTYTLNVTTVYQSGGEFVKIWIDYNNNGSFDPIKELAYSGAGNLIASGTIKIDTTVFFNQKLRMRVGSDNSSFSMTNANNDFSCGQIEDYYLVVIPAPTLPVPNFKNTLNQSCNTTVTFTNTSYNATSFVWNFADGSLMSSTFNATHIYTISGTYIASLTACNPAGCVTYTQAITIAIPQVPIPFSCSPYVLNGTQGALTDFRIDTISNNNNPTFFVANITSGSNQTCNNAIHVKASRFYYFSFHNTDLNYDKLGLFIDYNNDGVFNNYEYVNFFGSGFPVYYINCCGYYPIEIQIPSYAVQNTPLRMRVIPYGSIWSGDGCGGIDGNFYDFTMFIEPPLPTVSSFSVNTNTMCTLSNQNIHFNNTSSYPATSFWNFGDGTTSTEYSPQHTYSVAGTYNVKLKTSNTISSDSVMYTNYIVVNQSLPTPSITISGAILSTTSVASSYQWYKGSSMTPITGATSSSYSLTQDGDYMLFISNSNGCQSMSNWFSYYPVHLSLNLYSDTVCANNYVFTNHTRVNGTLFQLNWGDGTPGLVNWDGTGGPFHAYSSAGTYTIKFKGCGTYNCDSVFTNVVITVPQDTAVIVLNNGVFSTTTTATQYQWYFNNSQILGANSSSYTPTQDGYYNIRLTNSIGCTSLSGYYIYYPIHLAYTADTLAYCGVNTADVQFNNTTTNAINYLWSFGDGSSSNVMSPTHTYTVSGFYNIILKACSATTCDSLLKTNYIKINSMPFNPLIAVSSASNVCNGDSVMLNLSNVLSGNYQWYNTNQGQLWDSSATYASKYSSNYYVIVTNSIGCVANSNTLTIAMDNLCVWPGDVDYDWQVSTLDVLELGMHFNQTGIARSSNSNAWKGFHSLPWTTTQTNGGDMKYVDCNGDGTISLDDTLAIYNNYNLIAYYKNINQAAANYDLFIIPDQTSVIKGNWGTASIYLGDTTTMVSNINGLAYTLYFDTSLVETNNIWLDYPTSFINPTNQDLKFRKLDFNNSKLYTAITPTIPASVSGYGKIATLHFKIKSSITQDSPLNLYFTEAYTSSPLGNITPITGGGAVVNALGAGVATSLKDNNSNNRFLIYPNPTNGIFTIERIIPFQHEVFTAQVLNTLGQVVYSTSLPSEKQIKFNLQYFDSGIYYIKLFNTQQKQIFSNKISIQK